MTSSYFLIDPPDSRSSSEGLLNESREYDRDFHDKEEQVSSYTRKRHCAMLNDIGNHLRRPSKILFVLVLLLAVSFIITGLAVGISKLQAQLANLPNNAAIPAGHYESLSSQDVVVTVKTGHSVIWKRLPAHLENELSQSSTLPRVDNLLIYSDHAETFHGHNVIDALANVSDLVRSHKDFQPYFQQRDRLKAGESVNRLKGSWKLDKFKFLPILRHAFTAFPTAKWFINVESDTYAFYPALFRLLESLSSDTQLMLGSPLPAGDGLQFAHGGSGYVISNALLAATYGNDPNFEHRMDKITGQWCCGDSVLAHALFKDKHVKIKGPDKVTSSGFTGETPYSQRFTKDNWCSPIYTFHHVKNDEVRQLWEFEQQIWPRLYTNDTIRFIDVYEHFQWGFMRDTIETEVVREGWENRSEEPVVEEEGVPYDAAFCRGKCQEKKECWSWQWTAGECLIGTGTIRFGQTGSTIHTSGVRMDRINAFRRTQHCEGRPMRGNRD